MLRYHKILIRKLIEDGDYVELPRDAQIVGLLADCSHYGFKFDIIKDGNIRVYDGLDGWMLSRHFMPVEICGLSCSSLRMSFFQVEQPFFIDLWLVERRYG